MGHLAHRTWRDAVRFRWAIAGFVVITAIVVTGLGGRARARATVVHTWDTISRRLRMADMEIRLTGAHRDVALETSRKDGIADVEARLLRRGALYRDGMRPLPAIVQALPEGAPHLHRIEIQEGRYPDPGEPGIVVDRSLHRQYGIGVGDEVEVAVEDERLRLPVVGIALHADHLMAPVHPEYAVPMQGSVAVVGLSSASAENLPHADRVTSVLVRLEPGADAEGVIDALRQDTGIHVDHVVPVHERHDYVQTKLLLQAYDVYAPAVLVLLTVTGLLLLAITLSHLVTLHRAQVGILLAHGYGSMRIASSFLGLPLVSVLLGGALGALLHGPYARLVSRGLMSSSGFPPPVDAGPQPALFAAVAGCLVTSVAATLVSVLSLTRLPPARVLAPSSADAASRSPGLLTRLASRAGDALRMPPAVVLGLTHVARSRATTVAAALGVGVGLALVLASVVVHVTARKEVAATVKRWARDATLQFQSPAGPEDVVAVARAVEGRAEPFVSRVAYVTHGGSHHHRQVLGLSLDGLARTLPVAEGRGFTPPAAGEALVDAWLALHDDLEVGSSITLSPSPHAPEGIEVKIVGVLAGVSFGRIVLPLADAQRLFDLGDAVSGVHVISGLEDAELERVLWEQPRVEAVFPTARIQADIDAGFEAREIVLWMAVVASTVIALAFLVVVASIDVARRGPQLAVLHSLGWKDVGLGGVIVTEVAVRGALAVLVAAVAAPLLTRWVIGRMTEANGFRLIPHAPAYLHVAILGAVLLVLPLGALPAWRTAVRLDPTRLLRRFV